MTQVSTQIDQYLPKGLPDFEDPQKALPAIAKDTKFVRKIQEAVSRVRDDR